VFNFIEYLTSTLCINLHLGYHCTRLPPSSSLLCAPLLCLDSDYFSVSVLDPQSSDLPHSLPENQHRAFSTRDSVSNQGPSHTVGKQHFTYLYSPARVSLLTKKNIIAAWRGSGLFPFNPERVLVHVPKPSTKLRILNANELRFVSGVRNWAKPHAARPSRYILFRTA
jgi:hypothetical protein